MIDKIPNLKKLQSKFKKGEVVYFSFKNPIRIQGVTKGKIVIVNKCIVESRGISKKGRRTRIRYDVMATPTYNIKTKDGAEFIQVEEYEIFKKKDECIKYWINYVYAPVQKLFQDVEKIKELMNG